MKNLVVGAVWDLPVSYLLPFFSSLRKHYKDLICIITPETNEQVLNLYKQYNVEVFSIRTDEQMYKARHSFVKELLETKYTDVEKVFFTDVRDVYFFGNIFDYPFEGLNLFCEPKLIKDCNCNKNWIVSTYNFETYDAVKSNWIICNGTILGTREKILEYENILIKELNKVGNKFVMDQPITNVLFYKEKILRANLFYHKDGPIGTFCHDADLTIRDINEVPVLIAHQYDRSKKLREIVHNSLYFSEFTKSNKEIYLHCVQKFQEDPVLVNFRNFIKQNNYGYGDDAHCYMWKFLMQQVSPNFKFLEIGVYKGQILCLVKMLSSATVLGVTPLSAVGDKFTQYGEEDYLSKIESLHKQFSIPFLPETIINGLSTDETIKQKIRSEKEFDIVYIDGGHNFNTVVSDISLAKEICKKGGFIVMDDSSSYKDFEDLEVFKGFYDVSDAVNQCIETDCDYIERLCVGHNRVFQKIC